MKIFLLIITVLNLVIASHKVRSEELPYYKDASFQPYWLSEGTVDLQTFHQIPPFSFTDQSGKTITERDLKNKIYVAGFFFSTCPGLCPAIRSKLIKVQQAFNNDDKVKIVQHSIRPSTDTIEILRSYASKNGINNEQWHLLTGDKEAIYSIAKLAYFASEDLGNIQKNQDFLHTESLLLIDPNRHIRGIYNGLNAASVNFLIKDINELKTLFFSEEVEMSIVIQSTANLGK